MGRQLVHGANIAVILKNGKVLEAQFSFDNEEWVDLSREAGLFQDVTEIDDFRVHFLCGFKCRGSNNFELFIEELSDISDLDDLMEELAEYTPEDVLAVVLMTDKEVDDDRSETYREFCWRKIYLDPYRDTFGTANTERGADWDASCEYLHDTIIEAADLKPSRKKGGKKAGK